MHSNVIEKQDPEHPPTVYLGSPPQHQRTYDATVVQEEQIWIGSNSWQLFVSVMLAANSVAEPSTNASSASLGVITPRFVMAAGAVVIK
jgi:hypothetical protein